MSIDSITLTLTYLSAALSCGQAQSSNVFLGPHLSHWRRAHASPENESASALYSSHIIPAVVSKETAVGVRSYLNQRPHISIGAMFARSMEKHMKTHTHTHYKLKIRKQVTYVW